MRLSIRILEVEKSIEVGKALGHKRCSDEEAIELLPYEIFGKLHSDVGIDNESASFIVHDREGNKWYVPPMYIDEVYATYGD